jgi:hypothetical protein
MPLKEDTMGKNVSALVRLAGSAIIACAIEASSAPSVVMAESPIHLDATADTGGARSPCFFDDATWDDMTIREQQAWSTLGWSKVLWDEDLGAAPDSETKRWNELSSRERLLLVALGYSDTIWEADADVGCYEHTLANDDVDDES